jgi:hypothetical protein
LVERVSDHASLKGAVFKRKTLDSERVRGLGAFALSYGLYSYLPYLAVYFGGNLPLLAVVASGVYGVTKFSERNFVN